MVVLEGEAGDAKQIPTEESEKNEAKPPTFLSIEIFRITKDAQQQHGLRHGDYQRYRGYCSRRLRRLRKVLKIPQGDRRHYRRRDVTAAALGGGGAEARLLCVPLLQAERAWAHAMQLRQEANTEPRKKFHLTARLKKASAHAQTLLQLCEESGVCSARTQLEAGAYAAWLGGVLLVELQQWRAAADSLQRATIVLDKLCAALPEDDRQLYRQKVEELKPSLRYCAYNIGDQSAAGDLVAMRGQGLIDNLDSLMAQAKQSAGGAMSSVEWRGRRVAVRPEKARLFLLALQDLDRSVADAPTAQAKIDILDNILMDCKDAIAAVKEEIKNDPVLRASAESPTSGISYLLTYLAHERLARTAARNRLLLEQAEAARAQAALLDGKKVRPHDLVRLTEIILQNYAEMAQLPGLEGDAAYQQDVSDHVTAYRAFRCFYIAQVLTGLRRFREALAMLERCSGYAAAAGTGATATLEAGLGARLAVLRRDVRASRAAVHADSVLDDADQPDQPRAARDKKPLADRLDEYREDTALLTKNPNVARVPPPMEAIPCKPLFFDLACNLVQFPALARPGERRQPAGITSLVKGFLGWGKPDN